ncbi:7-keto-8-aminopelargonate synthetase and related enzyme [Hahella chejuensis KCTC 2396]|uniref:7-keto-8-aminopelargonate synthetase and related enzyme n=1 Tax=Hahella chejuensis (strain KCTC 2396) TaxID=349521 RepID=Q2SHH6_HAHCH|nr:pyridoxal phosphate-dependent aminotransferase family protein [Hahella chejuensis]ABC29898.1 7-keto-8-aminopelargonate synthetase and related enzyme [Hahella chejuensis KCTC 2396]
MFALSLRFNNFRFRKGVAGIPDSAVYKQAMAHYYLNKRRHNADLGVACQAFEQAYQDRRREGDLVNDLIIVEQDGVRIKVRKPDGAEFATLNLATNSYQDLDLEAAPRQQLAEYVMTNALSSCLSRKIAGRLPVHAQLEEEIRDFLEYESCLLATCGYIAQQAVLFALFQKGDVIFSDEHNHSSLIDGMRLTGSDVVIYPHLDYDRLRALVRKHRSRYNCAGIVSDGVFSAHGTMANLDAIAAIKQEHNLLSIIDDTHGFATIGRRARGVLDYYESRPDVLTASLAKGLAGFGGMVAASRPVLRVIDCFGRQNINTSHLSPLATAQSYFNLKHLRANLSAFTADLNQAVRFFNQALDRRSLKQYQDANTYAHPIFSFYGDSETQVVEAYQLLLENGFTGAFFPPPVAPAPTIRFSLHRKVDSESLTRLAVLIERCGLRPLSREYWPHMQAVRQVQSASATPLELLRDSRLASLK